ncbi:hypothetical protein [Christiangramia portivictoriae]|uniref:hypothetical protein n=1 Tax=Christiangramia portivictoriae TaxID=326069 RepID=UPI00041DF2CA|nr:hypothetical protein [Christiangramia portivictoriae]
MEKLIFVYNADSGKLNSIIGAFQKIVDPNSYNCSLCKLTYGAFDEKKQWRHFRENADLDMEFLHKDEFLKSYASKFGHKFDFPIILAQNQKGLEVLVSTSELKGITEVEELISKIKERT